MLCVIVMFIQYLFPISHTLSILITILYFHFEIDIWNVVYVVLIDIHVVPPCIFRSHWWTPIH